MSPALCVDVVDAMDKGLDDVETICLHLYGGEPLTNLAAVEAIVDQVERKTPGRFSLAVTTNGTYFTDRTFELLERGRFQVILSVDGPPEIHDACRRTATDRPTHSKVMAFLSALRSRTNCSVRGSAVVRSGWSLRQAEAYLLDLPVDAVKAQAVRGVDGTSDALSIDEREAYKDDLHSIGRYVIEEIEADRVPRDDRFSSRVLQLLAGRSRESFCAAGDTTFGVTPDGTVLPCVLLSARNHRLGHIADDAATWRKAGRAWRTARSTRAECTQCAAFALCGGGCPAIQPICGADECELIRSNCDVARSIFQHFSTRPEKLLVLAGIT